MRDECRHHLFQLVKLRELGATETTARVMCECGKEYPNATTELRRILPWAKLKKDGG